MFKEPSVPDPVKMIGPAVEDHMARVPALVAVIRAVHATAGIPGSPHGDFFTEVPGDRCFVTRIVTLKVGTVRVGVEAV